MNVYVDYCYKHKLDRVDHGLTTINEVVKRVYDTLKNENLSDLVCVSVYTHKDRVTISNFRGFK